MATDRARQFMEFLAAANMIQQASAAPTYVSTPNLRKRGIEGRPELQTRQYAAPVRTAPPPPPITGSTPGPMYGADGQAYADTVEGQRRRELDAFLASPAAQFLDPVQLEQAINRYRIPVTGGSSFPGLDTVVDQAVNAGETILGPFGGIPLTPPSMKPGMAGPSTVPDSGLTVGEATTGVAGEALEQVNRPGDYLYDREIEAGIHYAETGELPLWAQLLWQDIPGTGWSTRVPTLGVGRDGYKPTIDPGTTDIYPLGTGQSNTDKLTLPAYLESHPEKRATVNQIVADAKSNGQDPEDAVKQWWQVEQGIVWGLIARGIYDPLNLAGAAGAAGKSIRGAAELREAIEGASTATRVGKAVGTAVEVPATLIDAPWELLRTRTRTLPSGNQALLPTPIEETGLLGESVGSQYGTAEAKVQNVLSGGNLIDTNPDLSMYGPGGTAPGPGAGGPGTPPITPGGSPYAGGTGPLAGPTVPSMGPSAVQPGMVDSAAQGALRETYQDVIGELNRVRMPIEMREAGLGLRSLPEPSSGTEVVGPVSRFDLPNPGVETVGPTSMTNTPDIVTRTPIVVRNLDALKPNEVLPDVPEIITRPNATSVQGELELPDASIVPVAAADSPVITPATATKPAVRQVDTVITPETTPTAVESGAPVRTIRPVNPDELETLIPASYREAGAPPGFVTTGIDRTTRYGKNRQIEPGWSMVKDPVRQEQSGIAYAKEQIETVYPEQVAKVEETVEPFMLNVYEPNHNGARNLGFEGGGGMNLTARPLLEAEAWARMRMAMRQEGLPTENIHWRKDPTRQAPPTAERKAAGDYDKTVSKERYYEDYLFDPVPSKDVIKKLKSYRVIREDIGTNSPADVQAYWRYKEAERLRRMIHATDAELDAMIGKVGGEIKAEPVPQPVLDVVPDAELLQGRGSAHTAAVMRSLDFMGDEYKLPVLREIGPWANERFVNYDLKTARDRVLTDLELGGRTRVAVLRNYGVDINDLAVANGQIDVDMGGMMQSVPTNTVGDFAPEPRFEDLTQESANRGRDVFDIDAARALGWDIEDVLEQLNIERSDKFWARVNQIKKQVKGREAQAAALRQQGVYKGVRLDQIGLRGYTYNDTGLIEDAIKALEDAGFPTRRVGNYVSKRDASRITHPTNDLIHRAIIGDDDTAREARNLLYKRDDIPFQSTPPSASTTDTAARAWEQRGYDLYQHVYALRTMNRGSADNAIAVADNWGRPLVQSDWVIEETAEGFVARNPITGQASKPYKTRSSAQSWVNKFPEADDGTWLTAPECFI